MLKRPELVEVLDFIDIDQLVKTINIENLESYEYYCSRNADVEKIKTLAKDAIYWSGFDDDGKTARHTCLRGTHVLFPSLCSTIAARLKEVFDIDVPLNHITIRRTRGSLPVHTDPDRSCTINCFIKNGEGGLLRLHTESGPVDVVTTTGKCYFLNTKVKHEVIAKNSEFRYCISISFK